MTFFYYCFYRISTVYKHIDNKDYYVYGSVIVSGCQSLNLLSILSIIFHFLQLKQSNIIIAFVIISFCIFNLFILDKKKYTELFDRWKRENNKKAKGYFVLVYIIISILIYFATFIGLKV